MKQVTLTFNTPEDWISEEYASARDYIIATVLSNAQYDGININLASEQREHKCT